MLGENLHGEATAPPGTFSQVSGGVYHTCGLRTDGTVACWGLNDYGQTDAPAGTFSQVERRFSPHMCVENGRHSAMLGME